MTARLAVSSSRQTFLKWGGACDERWTLQSSSFLKSIWSLWTSIRTSSSTSTSSQSARGMQVLRLRWFRVLWIRRSKTSWWTLSYRRRISFFARNWLRISSCSRMRKTSKVWGTRKRSLSSLIRQMSRKPWRGRTRSVPRTCKTSSNFFMQLTVNWSFLLSGKFSFFLLIVQRKWPIPKVQSKSTSYFSISWSLKDLLARHGFRRRSSHGSSTLTVAKSMTYSAPPGTASTYSLASSNWASSTNK